MTFVFLAPPKTEKLAQTWLPARDKLGLRTLQSPPGRCSRDLDTEDPLRHQGSWDAWETGCWVCCVCGRRCYCPTQFPGPALGSHNSVSYCSGAFFKSETFWILNCPWFRWQNKVTMGLCPNLKVMNQSLEARSLTKKLYSLENVKIPGNYENGFINNLWGPRQWPLCVRQSSARTVLLV